MPASPRSVAVTRQYRERVTGIRARVQAVARRDWPSIDRLDSTVWPQRLAAAVAGAQTEAVRAAAGYLTAYLSTETSRRQRAVSVDTRRYAGVARDGRPLAEAFESPLIGVRAALKDGRTPGEALKIGLNRAVRLVGVEFDHAHRAALTDTLTSDPRFDGWQRVTAGTCGACLALSGSTDSFDVHPGCSCTPQPRVKGVLERIRVPDAAALFAAMTVAEQDAAVGAAAAEALRAGEIAFGALVERNRIRRGDDFVTQRPLDAAP